MLDVVVSIGCLNAFYVIFVPIEHIPSKPSSIGTKTT